MGVVGVAPLALLYAYWFALTGRLWPLIVAHALADFTPLESLSSVAESVARGEDIQRSRARRFLNRWPLVPEVDQAIIGW